MFSNKKILIFISMFFLSTILASCMPKEDVDLTNENTGTVVEDNTSDVVVDDQKVEDTEKMKVCEFVDQNGEKNQIYVLGNAVKTEGIDMNTNVKKYGLSKDDKYYIRSEDSKKGFVIDLTQINYGEYQSSDGTTKNVNSTDTLIEKFTVGNSSCKEEEKSDSTFEMPNEIVF